MTVDGQARGIVARDLVTGEIESPRTWPTRSCWRPAATATGLLPLDERQGLQRLGHLAGHKKGAATSPTPATRRSTRPASPSPATHQSKLTLMSESLRNDGRIWVPLKRATTPEKPERDPRGRARLLPRAPLPCLRQPGRPATSPRAPPKNQVCDEGRGVGPSGLGRVPRLRRRHQARWARHLVKPSKYGNLFEMYEADHGREPVRRSPMRIYPAVHYTMGGLWVDYNLHEPPSPASSSLGEANFSDHGANRLGAVRADAGIWPTATSSSPTRCWQLPRLAQAGKVDDPARRFREAEAEGEGPHPDAALDRGQQAHQVDMEFHRELGRTSCGSSAAWPGTRAACASSPWRRSAGSAAEFWRTSSVPAPDERVSTRHLEKAGRVADFLELGELMASTPSSARSPAAGTSASTEFQTRRGRGRAQRRRILLTSPPGSGSRRRQQQAGPS